MSVKTTTFIFDGTESPVVAAPQDFYRKYIGLYAKEGSCLISIGDGDHIENSIQITNGNLFEPTVSIGNAIYYSGEGSQLLVIRDVNWDGEPLSYYGHILYYYRRVLSYQEPTKYLPPPIFN